MDLVKLTSGGDASGVGAGAVVELELPAMRLGGAFGSGARTGGVAGAGVTGGGADWNRAATLPDLRAR